jgi:hypothetical protein
MARLTNLIGACVSVALVAGVAVWGYQLVMRDVSGIPVVRAAEGDMRVRPDNPGGQLALHQGLAVNEVAASGEAAGPVDRLVLAPQPTDLRADDAARNRPVGTLPDQDQAAQVNLDQVDDKQIDAMVASLMERAERTDGQNEAAQAEASQDGVAASGAKVVKAAMTVPAATTPKPADTDTAAAEALRNAPGLRVSARPQLRPIRAVQRQTANAAAATATPAAASQPSDLTSVPAGTRLVQLGALDTPEKARAQWDVLSARFGDYMAGKKRVIMPATTGGHKFYRLRAVGFEDLADARRFCSAVLAEGAECIPVVTR